MEERHEEEYSPYSTARYLESDLRDRDIAAEQYSLISEQNNHHHDYIEVFLVKSGTGELSVNGKAYALRPRQVVYLLPYHIHSIRPDRGRELILQTCHFSLSVLIYFSFTKRYEQLNISFLDSFHPVLELDDGAYRKMEADFAEIVREFDDKDLLYDEYCLLTIMRIVLTFQRQTMERAESGGRDRRNLAWRLLEYIQVNFTRDMDSAEVARKFDIGVTEVNRTLHYLTGENFQRNLHRVRIRNACAMLQFEDLSVSFISKYVGYTSIATFYRRFKEIKGATPDDFRAARHFSETRISAKDYAWKILLAIYERYDESVTIEGMAASLNMTPYKLNQVLEGNFGKSFSEMLCTIRLHYACAFLSATDIPITHIAFASGFDSIRTFNRCFREEIGTTPANYRKRIDTTRGQEQDS